MQTYLLRMKAPPLHHMNKLAFEVLCNPTCPVHISTLLSSHPSTQLAPNKKDRLRGVRRPPKRGAPPSGTACSSQAGPSSHLLPCVWRLDEVSKQPPPQFSGISLIIVIPFPLSNSSHDLPSPSPTFRKKCVSEPPAAPYYLSYFPQNKT